MGFDFEKEMVYGRKHLNKVIFDKKKYPLHDLVQRLFDSDLQHVHESGEKYDLFDTLGKDSHTFYHKKFYNKLDNGWEEFTKTYTDFLSQVALPYLGLEKALVQKYPTFRVQLPDNVAIVVEHYDSDDKHNHPFGEINFVFALTDMFDTNTISIEKMPRSRNFEKVILNQGECLSMNGNLCSHHNQINKTGVTRMSFDFRVLPLNYYNNSYDKLSVTRQMKYIEGGYYKMLETPRVFEPRDIWDTQKEKFNGVMHKYGVKDAWDIVDLFEKKIAAYSGSKYAVSVDNCTNALFLCIKYLEYKGEITIPSKTYCSVPCTIINAGCSVKFEDVEWTGDYQLKPLQVYDGAVRFRKNMYRKGTYHCLSFHIRKHLPIGKGGMILCDDQEAYKWFRTARYEGRHIADKVSYKEEVFNSIGWNMYMTPEQAARGLELFELMGDTNPDQESSGTCKDLSVYDVYTNLSK